MFSKKVKKIEEISQFLFDIIIYNVIAKLGDFFSILWPP